MILGGGYFPFPFFGHLHQPNTFQSTRERTSCSNKVPNHFWILKWPSSMLQSTLFTPFKFIFFSIAWSLSNLPIDFSSFANFYTLLDGIKVLGFPFGSSSFTSSFFQDILNNNVHHIKSLSTLGDIQVTFGIFFLCFVQRSFYFLCLFPPFLNFQH